MKKICIIDSNSGNLKSVINAIKFLNFDFEVSDSKEVIKNSSHLVLPGVGAYGNLMQKLKDKNLVDLLKEQLIIKKKYFLGICVGMQILSSKGYEFKEYDGLDIIKGSVVKFNLKENPIPHVGWNKVSFKKNFELIENSKDDLEFYFVNSYHFEVEDPSSVVGQTNYEINFSSVVQKENIYGVQFHPEKSQNAGLLILKNFLNLS